MVFTVVVLSSHGFLCLKLVGISCFDAISMSEESVSEGQVDRYSNELVRQLG